MTTKLKYSIKMTARIIEWHPGRVNEGIAWGVHYCAPDTIPARARYLTQASMIGLVLFKQLIDQGMQKKVAGYIACSVNAVAMQQPSATTISIVQWSNIQHRQCYGTPATAISAKSPRSTSNNCAPISLSALTSKAASKVGGLKSDPPPCSSFLPMIGTQRRSRA